MIAFTTGTATRINVEDCKFDMNTADLELDAVPYTRPGKNPTVKELVITCGCCKGRGEHQIGQGPDRDDYTCEPCRGFGHFPITYGNGAAVLE